MRSRRPLLTLLAGVLLAALPVTGGCKARRSLTITSDPPGAEIRLDDSLVGTTPQRIPFEHYGIRRVTLYLPGYHTHSEQVDVNAPWFFRFPIDFFSEVLLPFGWRDRRRYHVELEPGEAVATLPSLRSVIERANILRHAGPEGPRGLPETQPIELPPIEDEEDDEELP